MTITLEQARVLTTFAREGTFQRAAAALGKGHSSIVYGLRTLEEQTGLSLLDRSGYRTRLTKAGERMRASCERLLAAELETSVLAETLRSGWEPSLRVVMDGVVSPAPVLMAVAALAREAPTRFDVRAEFLDGVEDAFLRTDADLMISVLPPRTASLSAVTLPPVPAALVASRTHPLVVGDGGDRGGARGAKRARPPAWLTRAQLEEHLLLSVRGSDPRLELPTDGLHQRSSVHLNDFSAKKAAIVLGAGFGWLPLYLIEKELAQGSLRKLRWKAGNEHAFRARLYHRASPALGRAARRLVEALTRTPK